MLIVSQGDYGERLDRVPSVADVSQTLCRVDNAFECRHKE